MNWKAKIEKQLTEISKTLNSVQVSKHSTFLSCVLDSEKHDKMG